MKVVDEIGKASISPIKSVPQKRREDKVRAPFFVPLVVLLAGLGAKQSLKEVEEQNGDQCTGRQGNDPGGKDCADDAQIE